MTRRLLTTLALLSLAALALSQAVALKRKVTAGDVLKYRVTIIFTVYGNDVIYKALLTDKVTAVDKDGSYTVRTTQEEISASNGDHDLPVDMKGVHDTTTVYGRTGNILDIQGEQTPEEWRLANLGAFHLPEKPVNQGDAWTAEVQPDVKHGAIGAIVNYKLVGKDKVGDLDALLVSESYKEARPSNPAGSEGKVWVNPLDGSVLKLDADWRNAPILGLSTLVNAHVSYERIP